MSIKKLLVIALLFLAACKNSNDPEVVPAPQQDPQAANALGPFTVEFQGEQQVYSNLAVGWPRNAEGILEYYITVTEKSKVTLVSSEIKVSDCPASQVSYQTYWFPDATKTEGPVVMPGLSFEPTVGTKGTLMYALKGLSGCGRVELATSLKREKIVKPNPTFPVGQVCQGSTAGNPCTVQVYCREQKAPSTYVEVEIWKDSWGLLAKKFMRRSDGSRGLMASETTYLNGGTTSTTYSGSSMKLNYNNSTGVGQLKETVSSQTYTTDLDCAYL